MASNAIKAVMVGADAKSAAATFDRLWDALAGVLGTAAVAAIVRRAARRSAAESPELAELVIVREELDYIYTLPKGWTAKDERGMVALRVLARGIGRLLMELTGTVVVRLLEEAPTLQGHGLVWREDTN
jgi:hypothetical protein